MNDPPNGIRVRLERVEHDVGKQDGRIRAVEESGFRIEERLRTVTETIRDLRTEVAGMKKEEESRREQEREDRRADRRALWSVGAAIIGTIVIATIMVLQAAP